MVSTPDRRKILDIIPAISAKTSKPFAKEFFGRFALAILAGQF